MSKMSDIDIMVNELEASVQELHDKTLELRKMLCSTGIDEPLPDVKATSNDVKKYTFEEVRGIMATLASSGRKDEAKALLNKYGAVRLSEVKEDDYPALVADVEELTNG